MAEDFATNIPMRPVRNQRRVDAICVRRAYKMYGHNNNLNVILDGLNMTVPKGTIYGLLGASGCGKTTLLSCIVGRRRLNSGDIWVLGGKPGSRGSGVPGPRIGYMPQEIALYGEFTIKETLTYFGWLCGVSSTVISKRFEFLLDLLQLPFPERMIKNLSGGQQRRVSLAAAFVHDPELLILDEPTVGLDPLLRQNIWNHLVTITNDGLKTVIITTHYIDETRQANIIGLMRGGRFLVEESPEYLLQRYETQSLEDVFLKLAILQNRGKKNRSSVVQSVTGTITIPSGEINDVVIFPDSNEIATEISGEFGDNVSMTSSRGAGIVSTNPSNYDQYVDSTSDIPPEEVTTFSVWEYCVVFRMYHMKALMWKNILWMWRNFGVLCFVILLPVLEIILFCVTIGHDPQGLQLAVTNFEMNITSLETCRHEINCNSTSLSCNYLEYLSRRNNLNLQFYNSEEAAKHAVIDGKAWAALTIRHNYSKALIKRIEGGRDTDSWDIEPSVITIWQDMSDQQIGTLLYRDFNFAFFDFIKDVLVGCNINPRIASLPLKFNDAVYGLNYPNFTDFAAPGVILTIIFFVAVAITSGAMLRERNDGILERTLVVGITATEILFAFVGTEFLIILIHTGLVLTVAFVVFNLTIHGEILWIALLIVMTGMCGMCFGFAVSTACDNERTATYAAMGCFLPIVMLCGIIWPIEGMHYQLRKIAYFLPLTLSTESVRSMLQRGWSIEVPRIYEGFISTLIWILIFLTLSIFALKFRKG